MRFVSLFAILACAFLMFGMAAATVPQKAHSEQGALECELCTFIMSAVESQLTHNNTEAEVEKVLDDICLVLPSSIRSVCDELIATYYPELVQMFLAKETPAQVCEEIKLCAATITERNVVAKVAAVAAPEGVIECTVCEFVMKYVELYIASNSSESNIEAALEKVCSIIPSSLRTTCDSLVETYSAEIVQLLLNKESPATVCQQIGLCTSSVVAVAKPAATKKTGGALECELCQYIFSALESLLSNQADEAEVEKVLNEGCGLLPSAISGICQQIVDAYTPELIQLLVNKESPATICGQVGLCSA